MIGYLISIGSGAVLGISLLIWGLWERKARYEAEKQVIQFKADIQLLVKTDQYELSRVRSDLAKSRFELEAEIERSKALRGTLEESRKRLVECNDPSTIKAWIDAELKADIQ